MKTNLLFSFVLFCYLSYSQNISLTPIASGFENVIDIQNAGDDRLFVLELEGIIKILNLEDNTINPTPFLDISSLVLSGGESGLLGLAFHPNFETNGYFFINYTGNDKGRMKVSRFSINPNNPNLADPNSELLIIDHGFGGIHNGGSIAFGPDGFLYITSGDRGLSENGLDTTVLAGKILRIDVDNPSSELNYGIPEDNPFAGSSTNREEIWAYGLRNPFRMSIDTEENNIWIADVGASNIEEINKQPISQSNINYGWHCYEGTEDTEVSEECPNISEITFPEYEYTHDVGGSVIGGYVYRGNTYDNLKGIYFFADLFGIIGTVDPSGNGTILPISNPNPSNVWTTFGVDNEGELYLGNSSFSPGQGDPSTIYKIQGEILAMDDIDQIEVILSPNPSSLKTNIQIVNDAIHSIDILDMKGSVIYSESNINVFKRTIDTSSLQNGLYIVTIKTITGGHIFKKLIIQ